jgi:uncharacterized lipoprotein YmbA
MSQNRLPLMRICILVTASLWLAGCASSPPARFYTLNPLPPAEAKQSSPAATNAVSVSIAPVEIPDYLDRPQIVTRDGSNELRLAEFDRWGGSLSDSIGAVLAENLSQLLGTDRVYAYPRMRAEKADYTVVMRVLRLDCTPGAQVVLKAQWVVSAGPDKKDVATRVATYTERLNDTRYETMVAGVSRTLAQASQEIAREIPGQK